MKKRKTLLCEWVWWKKSVCHKQDIATKKINSQQLLPTLVWTSCAQLGSCYHCVVSTKPNRLSVKTKQSMFCPNQLIGALFRWTLWWRGLKGICKIVDFDRNVNFETWHRVSSVGLESFESTFSQNPLNSNKNPKHSSCLFHNYLKIWFHKTFGHNKEKDPNWFSFCIAHILWSDRKKWWQKSFSFFWSNTGQNYFRSG